MWHVATAGPLRLPLADSEDEFLTHPRLCIVVYGNQVWLVSLTATCLGFISGFSRRELQEVSCFVWSGLLLYLLVQLTVFCYQISGLGSHHHVKACRRAVPITAGPVLICITWVVAWVVATRYSKPGTASQTLPLLLKSSKGL